MSKYHISTSFNMPAPGQKAAYILAGKIYPPKCHGVRMTLAEGYGARESRTMEARACAVCKARAGVAWSGADLKPPD